MERKRIVVKSAKKKLQEIQQMLSQKPQYRECLFSRGYLITEDEMDATAYPFFSLWKSFALHSYHVYIHKDQDFCVYKDGQRDFLLIGHAYNPFNGVYGEKQLLSQLAEKYTVSKEVFFEEVSCWTGIFCVFVFDTEITAVQDCAGIKALYYGKINEKICFTSHPQLAADLYGLEMDPFVHRLIHNRFYNIGNRYLPGDRSPFKEIKRIGANVYLHCTVERDVRICRFYPVAPLRMCSTEQEYCKKVEEAYGLLRMNMELIAKKWPNSAISLSGGTDSKTTLACANGMYDRFRYFSFQSKDTEITDAEAAGKICEKIGIKHNIYPIPSDNREIEDFAELKAII